MKNKTLLINLLIAVRHAALPLERGALVILCLALTIGAQAATQYSSGTMTWSSSVWSSTTGGPYASAWVNGNDAVLEGVAGTVTAHSSDTINSITFSTTGYTLSGSTLTMAGSTPTIKTGVDPMTETISSIISAASGGLTIDGGSTSSSAGGALTLSGANTISGGTTLQGNIRVNPTVAGIFGAAASAVTVGSGSQVDYNTGSPNSYAYHISGTGWAHDSPPFGALRIYTGFTVAGTIVLDADSQIAQNSGTATVSAVISGAHMLTTGRSSSGGTLMLSGANTYSGGTTINASTTLKLGAANAIPGNTYGGDVTVNGALDLNNKSESMNGLNGMGTVDNSVAGTPTLTVGANGDGGSFSGVIKNTAAAIALVKSGAGTQILSGVNTYTGNTTINAGKLVGVVGGSCASSAVSVAATSGNTAILSISITDNTKGWTNSSLTVNNGGTSSGLDFNFGSVAPSATVAPLQVTGAATFTTTPSVTVELAANNVTAGTSYPLVTWGSTSGTAPTSVTVTASGRSTVAGHLAVVGTTLNLVIDTITSTEPLSWTGGNGTWDVANSGNVIWKDNTSASTYYLDGDTVVFDNTVGSGGTVTLNTTVSPVGVTVNNPSADYTISGSGNIAGTTGLTKSGAGTLTLATTNTYTGVSTLNAGTLNLGMAETAGISGPLGISVAANPGSIVLNGGTLQYSGVNHNDYSGRFSTATGQQYNVDNNGQNVTWATALTSSGATLTKIGNGTLTLSGVNTYSGATTINAGKLVGVVSGGCAGSDVSVAATSGNTAILGVSITANTKGWTNASLTFNNGGISSGLDFNFGSIAPSTTVAPLQVIGTATFTTTPAVTVELVATNVTAGMSYPLMAWGSTSGTAPTGLTLTASGRSTVTGHLAVVGSTLYLVIDTAVNLEPLSWTGGSGIWDINNSGNLIWQDNASNPTYFQTGDTVVFDNTVGSGGTVTLNTTVSPVGATVNNPSADYTISGGGAIAGTGGLTKSGAGTLNLATSNSYSGGTTISGGTLALGGGGNLGSASGGLTLSGGTLDLGTLTNTVGAVSITAAAASGNTIQNGSLQGASYLANLATGNAIVTANLAGSAGLTVKGGTITSGGMLVLSGTNTYTGATTLSTDTSTGATGVLQLTNNAQLATSGITINGSGTGSSTLELANLINPLTSPISLFGSRNLQDPMKRPHIFNVSGTNTISASITLIALGGDGLMLRSDAGQLTLLGNLSHNFTSTRYYGFYGAGTIQVSGTGTIGQDNSTYYSIINKYDSGTLTLGSANTFSGGLNLYAGTLNINNATALGATTAPGGGVFTIAGGTIDNTSGGAITVANNNPQNWNGNFTFTGTGDLNLGTGSVTLSANSQVTANGGTLTVGGAISGSGYGLTKAGAGTLGLSGANTYTGNTTINAGALLVNGSLASGGTAMVNGGTLGGSGTINEPTTVSAGASLAAGVNGIGSLTINNNLTLNAASTNKFVVTTSGGASNQVVVAGTLTPNSSIIEINTAGDAALGAGTNVLFTYPVSLISGVFTATPVFDTPQTGIATNAFIVDDSLGHINLVITNQASVINPNPTNITFVVSGHTLTLSWPTDHAGWILQQQTNSLNVGLSTNWMDVPGSASITSTNISINPVMPTVFYRLRLP